MKCWLVPLQTSHARTHTHTHTQRHHYNLCLPHALKYHTLHNWMIEPLQSYTPTPTHPPTHTHKRGHTGTTKRALVRALHRIEHLHPKITRVAHIQQPGGRVHTHAGGVTELAAARPTRPNRATVLQRGPFEPVRVFLRGRLRKDTNSLASAGMVAWWCVWGEGRGARRI